MDTKKTLAFLDELMRNNNREWFNAHKSAFLTIQDEFHQFAKELIAAVGSFDETISGLELKDCTYRIYRDIRFSPNKQPYKTHLGAYLCPGGKKSQKAGYYFHLQPDEDEYLEGCLLAVGCYNPSPAAVKSIREEIDLNGAEFDAAVKEAKNFTFTPDQFLQRVPNGYDKNHPYANYLKLKTYSLVMPLPKKILASTHLMDFVIENFKSAQHINDLLNHAIDFANEEK